MCPPGQVSQRAGGLRKISHVLKTTEVHLAFAGLQALLSSGIAWAYFHSVLRYLLLCLAEKKNTKPSKQTEVLATELMVPFKPTGLVPPSRLRVPADSLVPALGLSWDQASTWLRASPVEKQGKCLSLHLGPTWAEHQPWHRDGETAGHPSPWQWLMS